MDSEESPVSRKASSALFGKQKEKMASDAPHTTGEENQQMKAQEKRRLVASTSDKDGKSIDPKTLRRLAQNREAAKKSRLRKKAYIQQLESSKIKLTQLEQDLQRARAQGLFLEGCGANENVNSVVFDMEYSRWLAEDCKNTVELRRGLETHLPDAGLRVAVDRCLTHYDELFQLKATTAKSDVFHIITGVWTTPAERCFLWMGGFRPSELLRVNSHSLSPPPFDCDRIELLENKSLIEILTLFQFKQVVIPQLDPLTEQQLVGIYNLQQSSQQAEEALSQGLEQFQLSLANTVASDSLIESANLENYMGHMAMAVGKLANLEGFVRQADNLRQQSLHQMHRILTTRQAARCFLAIGEYHSRLRALSSLWASRPRENLMNESALPVTTELQTVQQPVDGHFSGF
ncbi:hypothetical protein ZIOFF_027095 [Zingiber officinale]|uniref:Uncharacterized protein n=1 Tax=Zingiber officinale TaxID=94328 RepID=A0A8J5H7M6_ZINOF|nr:hypothetical protein ZIOFF_027095 [Zingiber officinale]